MPSLPKEKDKCPDQNGPDVSETEDISQKRSYYYDDAHGYENYDPDADDEPDENEKAENGC